MADATQKVSGTSHAKQTSQTTSQLEKSKEVKVRREKITSRQEKIAKDLKFVIERRRNTSDFHDSARVKLSKALESFLAETHPKEINHELVDGAVDSTSQTNKVKQTQKEFHAGPDPFFQNLEKVNNSDLATALDNLEGPTHIRPTTHRIDVFG
jgi:hypothetical protein